MNKMNRRRFAAWCAASACAPFAQAQAKAWPTRPVRFVVAFPPGGLADVLTRLLQAPLGEALGQPVIIDNRGGASGNVAAGEVVNNGRDGHTLLVTASTTESVNPVMFPRMPFDPQKDLQPVALLANSQLFLFAPLRPAGEHAAGVRDPCARQPRRAELTARRAAAPRRTWRRELFKQSANVSATHIPYRGVAPAIQDVLAGQIDFAFGPGPSCRT